MDKGIKLLKEGNIMLSKHKIKQFIKECESATFTIADLDQLYETEEAMCLAKMFLESRIEEDLFIRRLAKSCGCPHDGTCLCFEDGEELKPINDRICGDCWRKRFED